jgi:hypothetical protein
MKQLFSLLKICLRPSVLQAQNNPEYLFSYKATNGFSRMGGNGKPLPDPIPLKIRFSSSRAA